MRFKSVLGAIVFIVCASIAAFVVFVHTNSFGNLLTRVISDLSLKKTNTHISIRNIGISVFPPGIELNRVKVKKMMGPDELLYAELGKLGFYISLIELEERKLTFGEIRISDSVIDYDFPKKDEETTEIDRKLINKIFDLSEEAPVRIDTLLIENTRIHANHDLMEARRLKIFKKGKDFIARFHLSNIKPVADNDFSIDEAWGDLEISRNSIDIYRLKVLHDVQTLLVKGKIKNYPRLKAADADLNGEAHFHLRNFEKQISLPKEISFDRGFANAAFRMAYKNGSLEGSSQISVDELKSSILHAEKILAELKLSKNEVILQSAEIVNELERASLKAPVTIFDIDNKKFLPQTLKANLANLHLPNVLRFVPNLSVIKGEMTGDVSITHTAGDFNFKPENGFVIRNLGLVVGKEKPFPIIMVKSATMKDGNVSIIDGEVHISSNVTLPKSKFDVDGFVAKDRARFSIVDAQIDLEDLGNIARLDVKGVGTLGVEVSGTLKDTNINLKGKLRGFEVLGYRLGETETEMTVALGDDSVLINKFESKFGSTPISGTGAVNWDNGDIALGINSPFTNYHDLSQVLAPIFNKIDFLPQDLNFFAKVDASIYGKINMDGLKVKAGVKFNDLVAYGETINSGSLDLKLADQVLTFSNIDAEKGNGEITGSFNYFLNQNRLRTSMRWENIALSSFNVSKLLHLNIDSLVSGSLVGEGPVKDYTLNLKTKLFNTKSPNYKFEDTDFEMAIHPDYCKGRLDFLGDSLTSVFDVALNKKGSSRINVKVNLPDAKPLLVALLGQHLDTEKIRSRVFFDLSTHFSGFFNDMNLTAQMKEFSFVHPEFRFEYASNAPDFIIRNNAIEKWNMEVSQQDLKFSAKGSGVFGNDVSLLQEIEVNSKIMEILVAPVLSSEGFIKNAAKITSKGDSYNLSLSSKTDKLNLSLEGVPFPLNDLRYNLELTDSRLIIHELRSAMDNGYALFRGDVFFDQDDPDVNIKYILDRAEIPILGKSVINLTGEGIIMGSKKPYDVTGEIQINRALVVNELNEFSSKASGIGDVKYLPKNQESLLGKLLRLNLNVKADNNIRVTNSLMDVSLRGETRIFGSPTRPRGEGRLYSPLNSSRVFFKNNEYTINSADIAFSPKKDLFNPDFDIEAMTFISNYRVKARAYGDLERFNFDLSSDPPLARNSIFSLIAFGYTQELQNSLTQKDQQSLTQIGMGSFVFDRFKISDILNKQFGLQVNLGTVFEQSGTDSLLSGRSQEGQNLGSGSLGRTKSATKIELKKRLDEAMSLSVSSTMGGSIGQRQSMNLTYSVNRNVQLEGVFENRTAAEGEQDIINQSAGGDLKFRWTFK
ncbi:MAG: translocation/assembly module TamB domain-containing protein [Bdellovibrionota bacterium]